MRYNVCMYQLGAAISPLRPLPAARADKVGEGGSSTRQIGVPKGAHGPRYVQGTVGWSVYAWACPVSL